MKKLIVSFLSAGLMAASVSAKAIDFDLEDPKGVNNIVFLLDAPLESINGTATGITGSVSFDPSAPEKTSGKVVVAVDSMSVANGKMVEHMMGGKWMDQASYPEITFELKGLTDVKTEGDKTSGLANGVLTMKGVSKELSVPVSVTYLEGKLAARQRVPGDIVVVRSNFSVSRSDFGINAGQSEDKVADDVELRLSVAGFAPEES